MFFLILTKQKRLVYIYREILQVVYYEKMIRLTLNKNVFIIKMVIIFFIIILKRLSLCLKYVFLI